MKLKMCKDLNWNNFQITIAVKISLTNFSPSLNTQEADKQSLKTWETLFICLYMVGYYSGSLLSHMSKPQAQVRYNS